MIKLNNCSPGVKEQSSTHSEIQGDKCKQYELTTTIFYTNDSFAVQIFPWCTEITIEMILYNILAQPDTNKPDIL